MEGPVPLVSSKEIGERLHALRDKTAALRGLVDQVQAARIDPSYPLVSVTVLDNFTGYALEDLEHGEVQRALDQLTVMEPMAQRVEQQMRSTLRGESQIPTVPRYVTSPIDISGPSFLAQTAGASISRDAGPPSSARTTRPVFFVGYGHFSQVRADIEKFPDYGINLIQIEFGPNSIFPREGESSDAAIRETLQALDRAAKANVAVNLQISPHYMPDWVLAKYPDLRVKRRGFLTYSLHAPEGQDFLQRFIETIVPPLKDHPALHSICISNEPINVEGLDSRCAGLDWHAWLEKRHGSVDALNALWGSAFSSFESIPRPDPFLLPSPSPQWYEFILFNQEFFAGWHGKMADAIHRLAPDLPVHAKAMSWTFFDENDQRFGVNADLFAQFSDISGNDSANYYSFGQSEWAQGWPVNAKGHNWYAAEPGKELGRIEGWQLNLMGQDLQRSLKDVPVFNSENHLVVDGETYQVPYQHVRTGLWQAAIHGMSATTIWVWERTFDTKSNQYGSIMHRPACAEAVGHTALDLQRLAEEVSALQRIEPPIGLLHSTAAMVYDKNEYTECLSKLYEALSFTGLKVGFVTERALVAGEVPDLPVILVPNVSHLPRQAVETLRKYPGRLVFVGGADLLTWDEYNMPQKSIATERIPYTHRQTAAKELWQEILTRRSTWGVSPRPSVHDQDGNAIWGVAWLAAEFGGKTLMNLVNYNHTPATIRLSVDGRPTSAINLFDAGALSGPVVLNSLEPLLVQIGA